MVVRPQILQGAPSSKLAIPPQLPVIGLFLKITPIARAAKEMVTKLKTVKNSITIIPKVRFNYIIFFWHYIHRSYALLIS
jgi:hypothetical protein